MATPEQRLGSAVAARMRELAMTHRAAAEASVAADPQGRGLSTRTITSFVSGERGRPHPRSVGLLEKTLGWPRGAVNHILEGGAAPDDDFSRVVDAEERVAALERDVQELCRRLDNLALVEIRPHLGAAPERVRSSAERARDHVSSWERPPTDKRNGDQLLGG